MKDKNLTNKYNSLSLDELKNEVNKLVEDLENKKSLQNSLESYQNLLKLNNIIENKFKKNLKNIKEVTRQNILKINSKKNEKKIK